MSQSLRRIVFGIGQNEEQDPHLPPALHLAEALGAELHVVHAHPIPEPLAFRYPEAEVFSPAVGEAVREATEQKLRGQLERAGVQGQVQLHVTPAPAANAILDVAEQIDADLIIVGATDRGAVSRVLLGTTAGRVVRMSPVPVLVNRRREVDPPQRILLTTDLSELSEKVYRKALEIIRDLAPQTQPELRTLLAIGEDLATPPARRTELLQSIAEKELHPFMERAAAGLETGTGKVRMGEHAAEILAEAEEWGAEMLVLGTHGRGGLSRFLIGSIAESVVRRAPCDVLVIPAAAFEPGGRFAEAQG